LGNTIFFIRLNPNNSAKLNILHCEYMRSGFEQGVANPCYQSRDCFVEKLLEMTGIIWIFLTLSFIWCLEDELQ